MPLSGEHLVVEPTFPHADMLMKLGLAEGASEADAADDFRVRNKWYSFQRRSDIYIVEEAGKITWAQIPAVHHIGMDLHTMGCSEAWGLEQEQRALQLLGGMISHHQMKMYVLTGMFLERSKRSGVLYIFRRLKPTVAVKARPGMPDEPNKSMEILCCLCMHPIAYYHGSWAGAMCPTDDVVAHLALMRGDERLFWARSNHHPPYRPEAGL